MATAHADRCRRLINLNSQTRQPWSADDSTDCSAPVWACASESSAILRRCICAFVSFPSEPAQRPVRRTAGRVCLSHVRRREESEGCVYLPRVRRQHPRLSTDGQCRSTARWDCHFRVVSARQYADRHVARTERAGDERCGSHSLHRNPARRRSRGQRTKRLCRRER